MNIIFKFQDTVYYNYLHHNVYFNKLASFLYLLPRKSDSAWLILGHHMLQKKQYFDLMP
jgi:hypothetical protein